MWLRVSSRCSLNSYKLGAVQWLTSREESFPNVQSEFSPMQAHSVHLCSNAVPLEEVIDNDKASPALFPPRWTNWVTSATPLEESACPQDIAPSWPLSSRHSNYLMTFLKWDVQNFSRGCQCGIPLGRSTVEQWSLLTGWWCFAWCTQGLGWLFWLSGHSLTHIQLATDPNPEMSQWDNLHTLTLFKFLCCFPLDSSNYQQCFPVPSCILGHVQNQKIKKKPRNRKSFLT